MNIIKRLRRAFSGRRPAPCSAAEEKRLRGNIRFMQQHVDWCEEHGHGHDPQDYFIAEWQQQLKAAGLELEPTTPNVELTLRGEDDDRTK